MQGSLFLKRSLLRNVEDKVLVKERSQIFKDREFESKLKYARNFILSHVDCKDSIVVVETGLPLGKVNELRKQMQDEGLIGDLKEKQKEDKPVRFSLQMLVTCQFCDLKIPESQLQKHIRQNHM